MVRAKSQIIWFLYKQQLHKCYLKICPDDIKLKAEYTKNSEHRKAKNQFFKRVDRKCGLESVLKKLMTTYK